MIPIPLSLPTCTALLPFGLTAEGVEGYIAAWNSAAIPARLHCMEQAFTIWDEVITGRTQRRLTQINGILGLPSPAHYIALLLVYRAEHKYYI